MFLAVFLAIFPQDVSGGGVNFASVVEVLRRLRLDDRVDTMFRPPCFLVGVSGSISRLSLSVTSPLEDELPE